MLKNYYLKIVLLSLTAMITVPLIWAGLHDITKGEENITAEIVAVSGSAVILVYVIFRFIRIRTHI